ncbi:hypothetical protein QJS10_CPA01g01075 [Acorus calamus]|uniref:Uncharacterized protein n=1 Tax=Acorus calamus TaxID=4465 RepID=A0AAV9FJ07_ACOCL|nr:hypothetical protein QJS10_CPA01g01075 [Acorus calamus]
MVIAGPKVGKTVKTNYKGSKSQVEDRRPGVVRIVWRGARNVSSPILSVPVRARLVAGAGHGYIRGPTTSSSEPVGGGCNIATMIMRKTTNWSSTFQ